MEQTRQLQGQEILKALPTRIGISQTKKGNPQVACEFTDDSGKVWTWYGSLNEGKAREITFNALKTLGFTGVLSELLKGRGINFTDKVSLTIDDELSEDGSKVYRKVKWINSENRGAELLDEATAMSKLQGLGIEADLAIAFGGQPKTPAQPLQAQGSNPTASDLPF